MSDLRHKSLKDLYICKNKTQKEIGILRGKIHNLQIRLDWIEHYIEQKETPTEYTVEELEKKLGHKIKIVSPK